MQIDKQIDRWINIVRQVDEWIDKYMDKHRLTD